MNMQLSEAKDMNVDAADIEVGSSSSSSNSTSEGSNCNITPAKTAQKRDVNNSTPASASNTVYSSPIDIVVSVELKCT